MRHILVKYCSNWADEFDIQGFAIMNEEEYIQWIEDFRKAEKTDYPTAIRRCRTAGQAADGKNIALR